jgi:hypothetical protein
MMKRYSHQQIEALLDKFMDGQTTVEEEALLADYFRNDDVPAKWEDYRLMFDYFDSGMEGELITAQTSAAPLMHQMGRRWWGLAAAAAITAVVVFLTVLRPRTSTTVTQQPEITEIQTVDTPVVTTPLIEEIQQLAVANPQKPTVHSKATSPTSRSRHLKAENDRLAQENERLQHELEDLKRRAFIIDMEANGYKAVMGEDGRIVFIDMEQEIENELNHQLTNNIPEI